MVTLIGIMKRSYWFLLISIIEVPRLFIFSRTAMQYISDPALMPSIMRMLAAPNLVFAAGFLFLGLDTRRYISYKPLLILGKTLVLLAAMLIFVKFSVIFTRTNMANLVIIIAISIWDAFCIGCLLFANPDNKKTGQPEQPQSIETEIVEID
ncbi:hypothetical protein MASR2M29_00420 [Spirochaetota bacterium]